MAATHRNPRLAASIMVVVTGMFVSHSAAQKSSELISTTSRPAEGLKPFNAMIGEWKGVGQPKRGSSRGAWTETLTCEWKFDAQRSIILFKSSRSKQFSQLILSWNEANRRLQLVESGESSDRIYSGEIPAEWPGRAVLSTVPNAAGVTYRCTIQQLSDIRATLLFETRSTPKGSFRRVAGIGYTRSGEKLAQAGGNQRKCVVTGGLGTIPVNHNGKTYYVCCQGCVQAFNDAPDAIIAEYQASLNRQ